ncbi:unnamed protein product [Scytosiphon promiscuus]
MQGFLSLLCASAALASASGFLASPPCASLSSTRERISSCRQEPRRQRQAINMNKGFGEPPPPKKVKAPKSEKGKQRDAAAKAYEDMSAAGIPEYNILIKPAGTEDYLPAGVMAVPRSQQVSEAIFEQEENLKKAAFRVYDKLEAFEEFEYGYTLKMFPDDPVTPIEKRAPSTNPIGKFFEGLLSPVNTAGMKGPEIEPPPPPPPSS